MHSFRTTTFARVTAFLCVLSLALTPFPTLHAVDPPPFLPSLAVAPVVLHDSAAFVAAVDAANTGMRQHHEVPLFLRVYQSPAPTDRATAPAFVLFPAGSFNALLAQQATFAHSPALAETHAALASAGSIGTPRYLKAVRFDGTHAPGWLANFFLQSEDESALLATVAAWKAEAHAAGLAELQINLFRVLLGATSGETHLVSFNLPTREALGQFLDWQAATGHRLPGAVESGLFQELTP